MIGYGVVMLAGPGPRPGEAFVLSAMNPLVLLTLIGEHITTRSWPISGRRHRARGKEASHLGAVLLFVRRGDKSPGRHRPGLRGLDVARAESVHPRSPATDRDRRLVAAATLGVWTWLAGFGSGGWATCSRTDRSLLGRAGDGARTGLTNTLHAVGFHGVEVDRSSR